MTLTQAVLVVLLAGAVVVTAGTRLARSADVIAARTHLGGAWVGSVLLAGATSLPELTTDIAAVRMGAVDLAAGDLFGSSMANMLILALVTLVPSGAELFRRATLDHVLYAALAIILTVWVVLDAVHGPGSIFSVVSPAHLVSALVAVGLMGVAVAALAYRAQGRFTLLEPSSALIVVGYVAGLGLLLMQSAGHVGQ